MMNSNALPQMNISPSISIVIPAKNEEEGIEELIQIVRRYADDILVVDGHSRDRTREFAKRAGARVIFDGRKGKGEAIRCALSHIHSDIVVFIDADFSHDPDDIPSLVAPILEGACDHVTGSRLIGGSSELHGGFDECFRLMGSSFITACINWKYGARLSDSQNGFRAIRTDVLRELDLREDITTIEQEMIMRTLHLGYRMGEVPTHEHKRRYGTSHIKLSRVWFRYVWCLVRHLLPKAEKII